MAPLAAAGAAAQQQKLIAKTFTTEPRSARARRFLIAPCRGTREEPQMFADIVKGAGIESYMDDLERRNPFKRAGPAASA